MGRIQPDLLQDDDFPVAFGRYTLTALLGEGGMARVFRAELQGPEGFRKAAAVKIVRAAVAAKGETLRRSLINEARLGGLLQHPNVVNTYDFGEVEGLPYIAMELIRGLPLDDVLAHVRPLPAPVAVELAAQICAGLDHAHHLEDADVDAHLVHRDLKPSNVIVSRDGLAKVMDFGIAKATAIAEGNTETGMTKGTPAYMSPEQVGGEPLDPRSDLFAMGSIVYELTTGKRLFDGDSIMSVLMSVIRVEERIDELGIVAELDGIAPGLGPIVATCLRRDPQERWPDAAELEHQLRLVSRALPPPPNLKRWVRTLMVEAGVAEPGSESLRSSGSGSLAASPARPPTPGPTPIPPTQPQSPALSVAPAAPARPAPPPPPSPPTPPAAATPPPLGSLAQQPAAAVPPTRFQEALTGPQPAAPVEATRMQARVRSPEGSLGPQEKQRSPILLLLLGTLLGGGLMAGGAFGMLWFLEQNREPEEPAGPVAEATPEPTATPEAPPEPTATPRPRRTPAATASTPAPQPTPAPVAAVEPALAEEPEPTPRGRLTDERREQLEEIRRRRREGDSGDKPAEAAEPTPEPKPTPEPEPATKPTVAATTETAPAPARTPPVSRVFRLANGSAAVLGRDGDDIRVKFAATVTGRGHEDATLQVHFNPPGARWIRRDLKHVGGGNYEAIVRFPGNADGRTVWYITARGERGAEGNWGSKGRPKELRVPR